MGLLWCDGQPKEKVVELYDMIQDNNQERLAADDKDFNKNLRLIFDFASTYCFKFEMLYMGTDEVRGNICIAPSLNTWIGEELHREALAAKEQRKAREERALGRGAKK